MLLYKYIQKSLSYYWIEKNDGVEKRQKNKKKLLKNEKEKHQSHRCESYDCYIFSFGVSDDDGSGGGGGGGGGGGSGRGRHTLLLIIKCKKYRFLSVYFIFAMIITALMFHLFTWFS